MKRTLLSKMKKYKRGSGKRNKLFRKAMKRRVKRKGFLTLKTFTPKTITPKSFAPKFVANLAKNPPKGPKLESVTPFLENYYKYGGH